MQISEGTSPDSQTYAPRERDARSNWAKWGASLGSCALALSSLGLFVPKVTEKEGLDELVNGEKRIRQHDLISIEVTSVKRAGDTLVVSPKSGNPIVVPLHQVILNAPHSQNENEITLSIAKGLAHQTQTELAKIKSKEESEDPSLSGACYLSVHQNNPIYEELIGFILANQELVIQKWRETQPNRSSQIYKGWGGVNLPSWHRPAPE